MKKSGFMVLVLIVVSNSLGQTKIPAPASGPVDWQILVDGKPIVTPFELVSIWINRQMDEPSFAEITLFLDRNKITDPHFYTFDKEIHILLGYHHSLQTVFQGRMVVHQIVDHPDEPLSSIVHCEGPLQLAEFSAADSAPELDLTYGTSILEFDLSFHGKGELEGMIIIPGTVSGSLGKKIKLNGLPSGFNKEVIIRGVEQLFNENEWRTMIHVNSFMP